MKALARTLGTFVGWHGVAEFGGFAAAAAAAGLVWTPGALVVVAAYLFNLAYSPRSKGGS